MIYKDILLRNRMPAVYLLTVALFCAILSGCEDFLVQEPNEQVSINEQFSTQEGVDQAVNGMYKSLESLISSRYFFYADLMGGNLTFTPVISSKLLEVSPGLSIENIYSFMDIPEESDFTYVYQDIYKVINEANLLIERTADREFLSAEKKDQIKAEALSARAYCHFLASLLYSQNINYTPDATHPGIVYNTRTLVAGVDYPSRKSAGETYSLLKADLEEALSLFTVEQALPYGPSSSYFNTITVKALFARIALQMNDWERAVSLATQVINESGISLMDGASYVEEWDKPEEPVSEIIFELSAPRTSDLGTVSSSIAYEFFGYTSTTNYNEFVASGDLLDLYDPADIRKNCFLEIFLPTSVSGITSDQPYYFTRKFQSAAGTTVMRLSELYLIRAEATIRAGQNPDLALSDINTIRLRAGLTALTDSGNILEEIFSERRRELAFEGHLFFDIIRYKKDVVRNKGCLSVTCSLSYPSDYYILPIPSSSILLNENMIQNEGY